jgi:hypothetical protein
VWVRGESEGVEGSNKITLTPPSLSGEQCPYSFDTHKKLLPLYLPSTQASLGERKTRFETRHFWNNLQSIRYQRPQNLLQHDIAFLSRKLNAPMPNSISHLKRLLAESKRVLVAIRTSCFFGNDWFRSETHIHILSYL